MKKVPKTYCRMPFKQVIVDKSGLMKFCYYNFFPWRTNAKHDYTFPDDKKHINDVDDINDWFHGSYMNQVRKSMLEGKPLKECIGCYQCEERGEQSIRQETNYKYFEKNKDEPLDNVKLETLNLKFGNKCNLKCKMCDPWTSSKLQTEWEEIGWEYNDPIVKSSTKDKVDYNWPTKEKNIEKLKAMAKHYKHIHFSGGEPLLHKTLFDWMQHCIDNNYAKNIDFEIVTNGTVIPPQFITMAEKFNSVAIILGIDGLDNTFNYIRYPGNFDIVERNANFYYNWLRNKPNSRFTINFCLQVFNLHHLSNFIERYTPLCINSKPGIIYLEDPAYMSYNLLNANDIKQQIKKLLILKQSSNNEPMNEVIQECLTKLSTTKQNWAGWKELKQFIATQDNHRSINIANYIPELAHYF